MENYKEKSRQQKNGYRTVLAHANGLTKKIFEKEQKIDELKEFFNARVILEHNAIDPVYQLLKGDILQKFVEVPVTSNDYCIKVCLIYRI